MSERIPLRDVDKKKWEEWKDREYSRKNISKWIVELVGGSDRGGIILLWEKTEMGSKENVGDLAWELEHVDNLGYLDEKYSHIEHDESHYRLFDEIHFMRWNNAKGEYNHINSKEDITNLAWRNR